MSWFFTGDPFNRTTRFFKFIVVFVISAFLSYAKADTVFVQSLPGSKVSVSQASKTMAKGTPVYKCEKVRQGPTMRPRKVPGSTATWHTTVGTGLENPFDILADNKTLFRCALMEANFETAGARKVAN